MNNKPSTKDKAVKVIVSDTESFGGKPYRIEVYVDWVAIIRTLGAKAVRNKHRRASLMYGSIIVKAK